MKVMINDQEYVKEGDLDSHFWTAGNCLIHTRRVEELRNGEDVSLRAEGQRFAEWLFGATSVEFREGLFLGMAKAR